MIKRLMALLMALLLALTSFAALAEEGDVGFDDGSGETSEGESDLPEDDGKAPSAEEINEIRDLDEADENDENEPVFTVGPTYHEMELSEVTPSTPVLYTCRVKDDTPMYSIRAVDREKIVGRISKRTRSTSADVLYVGSTWCILRWNNIVGYVKRDKIFSVTAVDPVHTPPYGVQKSAYLATTADTCHVRKSMSDEDDCHVVLNPGTLLSIWKLQDGWAIVPYWRTYGYINLNELTDLVPVSPTDEPLRADTPIAAYTSYYSMADNDINRSRLVNIDVGCRRLSRVMAPGESFNFNKQVGPYRKSNGYQPAWVLVNGTSVPGYGGGTCQVSSTLYNALLQLPNITILQRRPHGPSGAKYLPHGVDAAVGNDSLNLRFRNDYPFPIRIEGHTSYDGALLMVVYRATDEELTAYRTEKASN